MPSPLISVPPAPASPARTVVEADGWYPDIDCNAMRAALRIGDVVTHDRLVAAIEGGLITVMGELRDWRAEQDALGIAGMGEVSPETIGENTRLELLFIRAVRFAAAAELAELHRDITATDAGQARADQQLLSAADYRRLQVHAVRDILGVTRTAVELI